VLQQASGPLDLSFLLVFDVAVELDSLVTVQVAAAGQLGVSRELDRLLRGQREDLRNDSQLIARGDDEVCQLVQQNTLAAHRALRVFRDPHEDASAVRVTVDESRDLCRKVEESSVLTALSDLDRSALLLAEGGEQTSQTRSRVDAQLL